MSNTVLLAELVYHICDLYMYDVLFHGRDIESVIAHVRNFFGETAGVQYSCTKKNATAYSLECGCSRTYSILKTDHKNLTYRNLTLTGKVLRWKLYLQVKDFYLYHVPGKEVHQGVQDALSYLCEHHMQDEADSNPVSFAAKAIYPNE